MIPLLLSSETSLCSRLFQCLILMVSLMVTIDAVWQDAISTEGGSTQVRSCIQLFTTQRNLSWNFQRRDHLPFIAISMGTVAERMSLCMETVPTMNRRLQESSPSWCQRLRNLISRMITPDSALAEERNRQQESPCGENLVARCQISSPWSHLSVDQSQSRMSPTEETKRLPQPKSLTITSIQRIFVKSAKNYAKLWSFTETRRKILWACPTLSTLCSNIISTKSPGWSKKILSSSSRRWLSKERWMTSKTGSRIASEPPSRKMNNQDYQPKKAWESQPLKSRRLKSRPKRSLKKLKLRSLTAMRKT